MPRRSAMPAPAELDVPSVDRIQASISRRAPQHSSDKVLSRGGVLFVGSLCLLVAASASWRLSAPSLWLDEGSTWAISGHGLADLIRALRYSEADAGGLYLLVEHVWLRVWGTSVVDLRSFSVVCAVAAVPLFFGVARRLLSRAPAWLATALFACSPFLLTYSRDARMYTFALALSLAATYCFVRLVRDAEMHWVYLYALTAGLAIYAHAFAILVVAAHAASLFTLPRVGVRWRHVGLGFALTAVSALPLLAYVVATHGRGVDWIMPLNVDQARQLATSISGGTATAGLAVIVVVTVANVFLVAVTWRRRGRSPELWSCSLALFLWIVPVVATALVSLVKPFFVPRYLLVALTGYALSVGFVLEALQRRAKWMPIVVVAMLVAVSSPAIDRIWGRGTAQEDWRSAESYVALRYRAGDGIVVPVSHVHAFGYYAARDPRLAGVHPMWDFPYGPWTVAYRPARHYRRTGASLSVALGRLHTVWVVIRRPNAAAAIATSWRSGVLESLRQTIRNDPERAPTRQFHGVVVYRYRNRSL
jgi:uncharacterized membrane protein